jgi:hypothetical protein
MDADQKANVQAMISEALGASAAVPGLAPQAPSQPAPEPVHNNEPAYPSEVPLDEYEALMVEALGWRVEAYEKTQLLMNKESTHIADMKNELLKRCVGRLQLDVSKYNMLIDSGTKKIKIQKRG